MYLEIIGHNFNQGILAALRAYPDVLEVRRNDISDKEQLLISFKHRVDAAPFIHAIADAGGQIEEIIWR